MSVISLLIIDPEKLPSFKAVREEAAKAGDPIEFVHEADLDTHTGFLPVRVNGRDTGFEYFFEPVPDGALPTEATKFGSHHVVTRTGSDFEEARAALLYLRIAARISGGAYVYPDDSIIIPPHDVEAYLDGQINVIAKYIK